MFRSAVERQRQNVGEALWRMSRHSPEALARIPDAELVISFRHVLVHGYDVVDNRIVWDALQEDLPTLRRAVEALLSEYPPPPDG